MSSQPFTERLALPLCAGIITIQLGFILPTWIIWVIQFVAECAIFRCGRTPILAKVGLEPTTRPPRAALPTELQGHGGRYRTRTYNPAVNSRMLYHWANLPYMSSLYCDAQHSADKSAKGKTSLMVLPARFELATSPWKGEDLTTCPWEHLVARG